MNAIVLCSTAVQAFVYVIDHCQ